MAKTAQVSTYPRTRLWCHCWEDTLANNEKFLMSMKTDYYFLMYLTLHDNNYNDCLQYINSFEEGKTLELSAYCISGKLSAAMTSY